ncbi:putative carbonic anhydrase 3 [Amphibalanus amphitrite]|uniref:carbonic anhydrase n=2 Tax=Amphibalanus amphitrite TaxID=1232801 RepID=A0A6A4VXE8_AMPAM|nr:putative carbonic anhydrase 3 [Amphibalanus amphitrite]
MRLSPALDRIRAGGASTLLSEPPSLLELMPNDLGHFYRYEGSLTTPGCYEVVTWTIFKQPVQATEQQMARFRTLTGLRSRPIGHNYRLVQLPYGRQVFERRPLDEAALEMKPQRDGQEAAASGPQSSATAAVASLLLLQLAATLTTLSAAVALTL